MKTKAAVEKAPEMTQAEHAPGPAVVRVVELVGVSARSWEDAAQQVVARASRTIRHVTGLDLVRSTAVVRDGRFAEYHVTVKLAFVVEPEDAEPAAGREGEARQAAALAYDDFGIWGSASDLQ